MTKDKIKADPKHQQAYIVYIQKKGENAYAYVCMCAYTLCL